LDEASVLKPIALRDVLLLFYFQNQRSSCKKQNLKELVHHDLFKLFYRID